MVFVAVEDQVGTTIVEYLPQVLHLPRRAVGAGVEGRSVKIGERAEHTVIREILPQPVFLRGRRRWIGARAEEELAVERDQMPATDVVAVVALSPRAGAR